MKRESQKSISPIRLRAYERLALLLERTKPEHMLMELRAKEPEALATWTIPQLQQYLLQTIRAEFDHNQSQQVYATTLLTAFNSNGVTPTDKALEELKREAKDLM